MDDEKGVDDRRRREKQSSYRSDGEHRHSSHHSSSSPRSHHHHRSDDHHRSRHRSRHDDGGRHRQKEDREHSRRDRSPERGAGTASPQTADVVTQTHLNELNAKILKARLRKDPKLHDLEREYQLAEQKFYATRKSTPISSSSKRNYAVEGKNEDDMTAEEMLKEERMTTGMDKSAVKSILKDKKFSTDLDYQDDNSSKLAKYVEKGAIDLKKMETTEAKKLYDALDRCQLCIENDEICCEMLSMASNVYLTLPPAPEIAKYSAMIVPINHVKNTLYCDEDEWEEIRNYMVSLSKFYYERLNKSVIFYETSIYRHNHAAIVAVPIPMSLASSVQGYFKQAIIEHSTDFEQQHKAVIDTLERSNAMGRDAFRHSIAREAPFFHVWFSLNGGLGHIVEDVSSWPKGDLFSREVLGGLLRVDPMTIRKQGRWQKDDERVLEMSSLFKDYDWAEQL